MSSETKDPLQKQDTPSESSESHSDSEVNLDHLKIDEQQAKDEIRDNTNQLDSPNQEGSSTNKDYLSDEPIASSSGLQKPLLASFDGSSDLESKEIGFCGPSEEDSETKEIAEIIKLKTVETDSNTTDNSPLFKQTSTGSVIVPPPIPDRPHPPIPLHKFGMAPAPARGPLLKRGMFAIGSANTLSDVSEIRSEVADLSTEGSAYLDAQEDFEKENSPSVYEPAVESPSSEASDANISDLPEESIIISTSSTSLSISTPSGEQGHQAYLAMLEREANERVQISTSSGIGSTNQSELANLQRWGLAGEMGHYRPNLDDIIDCPNQEVSENSARGEEPLAAIESKEDEQISEGQGIQDFDSLFHRDQQDNEDSNRVEGAFIEKDSQRQKDEEKIEISEVGADSTPAKLLSLSSDSSKEENATDKPRIRIKPDIKKKEKTTVRKLSASRQSCSESPEPKSSSSDEIRRKDSPEIRSSSGTPDELSQYDKGKKLWQKPGQLRNMQLSTVLPKDSVITEEDEQISPLDRENPELMETKEDSPEKMQTSPEKDSAETELSESKPSTLESSDQADGSEIEATLHKHELSLGATGFERTAGRSKRPGAKLSTSPPSDEITSSTPPKEGTSRPKKKARADKKHEKSLKSRHDSGSSARASVGLDESKPDDSTSVTDSTDYSASDEELEEEETEL